MAQVEAQQGQNLTQRTKSENEAKLHLDFYEVRVGDTIVKKSFPTKQGTEGIVTNVYPLSMKSKVAVKHYHVAVIAIGQAGREQLMTGPKTKDFYLARDRASCQTVMLTLVGIYKDVFSTPCFYYDQASILYAVGGLKIAEKTKLQVEVAEQIGGYTQFRVELDPVGDITVGDLSYVTSDVSTENKTLEQFLNIATAKPIFLNPNYVTFSASVGYMYNPIAYGFTERDMQQYPSNSSALGIGFTKSVRIIEGSADKLPTGVNGCFGGAGLLIESRKTAFHNPNETVYDKAVKVMASQCQNETVDTARFTGINTLTRMLKGLVVYTSYRQKKVNFVIKAIANFNSNTAMVPGNPTENPPRAEMSTAAYFLHKYGIQLAHPTAPLVAVKQRGIDGKMSTNYYPMELCFVEDNQRVKTDQQSPDQTALMIRQCAVAPDILQRQIQITKNSFGLDNAEALVPINTQIGPNPITVMAKNVAPPTIQFGGESRGLANVNATNGSWMGQTRNPNYFFVSQCTKWAAYAFCSGRDRITPEEFSQFMQKYQREMGILGVHYPAPVEINVFQNAGPEHLKQKMIELKQDGVEFVFVAHPDKADDMHHMLKYCELKMELVTQGLIFRTIKNVVTKGSPQTLQNIVNKTNVKLGGLNYVVAMNPGCPAAQMVMENGTLFIGFGINHPAGGMGDEQEEHQPAAPAHGQGGNGGNGGHGGNGGNGAHGGNGGNGHGGNGGNGNGGAGGNGNGGNGGNVQRSSSGSGASAYEIGSSPTVIGFSANTMANPFAFCGSFHYQEARQEIKPVIMANLVALAVKSYTEVRGSAPLRVIIYRHGTSEGQHQFIMKYELPLIENFIQRVGAQGVPITYIIPNKLQSVRFFKKYIDPRGRLPEKNIRPGTVIDTGITHPCITEFYLHSHPTIQGTGRTPSYTVLRDDNNLTLDQLESITYVLCFGHQITFNGPTSLPTPVYVGEEYAKRGRNLYNNFMQEQATSGNGNVNGNIKTYDELTEHLGHHNYLALKGRRVNA